MLPWHTCPSTLHKTLGGVDPFQLRGQEEEVARLTRYAHGASSSPKHRRDRDGSTPLENVHMSLEINLERDVQCCAEENIA